MHAYKAARTLKHFDCWKQVTDRLLRAYAARRLHAFDPPTMAEIWRSSAEAAAKSGHKMAKRWEYATVAFERQSSEGAGDLQSLVTMFVGDSEQSAVQDTHQDTLQK
uniref:Uncharacterized protein n=1 Tax=Branchiostoma floridae TaxID=7739 RepID=C3YY03_BRAFL|eukprot:XP_002598950.1 hypothetical protein BRAFLDRAFT_79881 [Branchiostoma floridae]